MSRLLSGLLSILMTEEERREVVDDLEELYRIRRARRGRIRASMWILGQVVAFPARLLVARLREGLEDRFGPPSSSCRSSATRPGARTMESLIRDLLFAGRTLRRSPGFTAVVILTLAVGIGANAAIFSVVDAVLLRPLPYEAPDELMTVWQTDRQQGYEMTSVSPANFVDWREQGESLAGMAASFNWSPTLTGFEEPERLAGATVTHGIFSRVLRVEPLHGRTLVPEDDRPDAPRVAILAHSLWQRRFGGDAGIVGRTITLSERPYTVVGVMPPGIRVPTRPDAEVWRAMTLDADEPGRGALFIQVLGRLAPGVDRLRAQTEMDAVAARLEREYPDTNTGVGINVVPLSRFVVRGVDRALWILLAAVGFVLLLACANVANLMLARASTREAEFAVRAALGAGRIRLLRQVVTESLVLALTAGALGTLIAQWGVGSLVALAPAGIPRLDEVGVDLRVLGFCLAAALSTGLLFGIVPALQASRTELADSLREDGRSGGDGGRRRGSRRLLVIAQVAIAVVLLTGSTLMVRSFLALTDEEIGFEPSGLLTARINLGGAEYEEPASQARFFERLLERLDGHPEVRSAAVASFAPYSQFNASGSFSVVGRPEPPPNQEPVARQVAVSEGFFETAGIRLLRGRAFSPADRGDAARVAVINRAAARRFWPDEDPLGQRLHLHLSFGMPEEEREIVGVVDDVRYSALDHEPDPQIFIPFRQQPTPFMNVVVRTRGEPGPFLATLRSAVHEIDPDVALYEVGTMLDRIGLSVATERFYMLLLTLFAVLALGLAVVGVYGVLSYDVVQRSHEMGVRLALGARSREVTRLVLRDGMAMAATGIAVGLVAAFALTRTMESMLHEVAATDPLSFGLTVAILATVAAAASYLPARRAARVDPLVALRGS